MLRIPNNFLLSDDCVNLLTQHLKDYIIYYYKDNILYEQGFDIYLHNDYLRVKFNHKIYSIAIIKSNNLFYYYLNPYKKSYITLLVTSPKVFNTIIDLIKEHNLFLEGAQI